MRSEEMGERVFVPKRLHNGSRLSCVPQADRAAGAAWLWRQRVTQVDNGELWHVSFSRFHEKASRVKCSSFAFPLALAMLGSDRGPFHQASIRTRSDPHSESVHVEVRGRRVLQSCYRPLLAKGPRLKRSHPDAACSIHRRCLQAALATVAS
jgi:hypothetical protein